MSARGACGGKKLKASADCTINVMVVDSNVNTIYSAIVSGSAGGQAGAKENIEAAWDVALAKLPAT